MYIDTITTDDKKLLLIESGGAVKLYERLYGSWEPITAREAEEMLMSGKAQVKGIEIADPNEGEGQL